jgi:hypothetical protein
MAGMMQKFPAGECHDDGLWLNVGVVRPASLPQAQSLSLTSRKSGISRW